MKVTGYRLVTILFLTLMSLSGCGPDRGGNTPVADAGLDQNIKTGSVVALDGSGSYDADPDTLNYSWSFGSMPDGSNAILSGETTVNPTFIADIDGIYVLSLVVNDGILSSTQNTVTITAATDNSAPVASAGLDQNIETGSLVTLDGSDSSDANSNMLTYSWAFSSLPGASSATLSDPNTVNPTFTADLDGSYVLTLVVNDGLLDSAVDVMIITAATANSAPDANAGADQNVATGSLVSLDGSGSSDADVDPLIYDWSFSSLPAGSSATLSDSTTESPSFTADLDGSYVLNLVVNDGLVDSATDAVIITAATANSAPTANAGPDQAVATGTLVRLDGSDSSDANGDTLTYSWAFTSKPDSSTAALSDSTAEEPSFTADLDGSYVLNLVVNDGLLDSTVDVMIITAATANSAPTANAGPDQIVTTGSTVTLDGNGSFDANDDTLTYDWSFSSVTGDVGVTLTGGTTVSPSFVATTDGSYVLDLVVNDGTVDSAVDSVTIISE